MSIARTTGSVVCRECGDDRVRRWEEARAKNGLTEEDWPRPPAPEFADAATLAKHRARVHVAASESNEPTP